jgi:hypothetical protein
MHSAGDERLDDSFPQLLVTKFGARRDEQHGYGRGT